MSRARWELAGWLVGFAVLTAIPAPPDAGARSIQDIPPGEVRPLAEQPSEQEREQRVTWRWIGRDVDENPLRDSGHW